MSGILITIQDIKAISGIYIKKALRNNRLAFEGAIVNTS